MDKNEYKKYTEKRAKTSPCFKNCVLAFLGGGAICCIGQGVQDLLVPYVGLENAKTLESVTLIALAGILTGLGWFDIIAKYVGAGTLVPITGFANAIAAAAIDNKKEGFITGIGAKMFIIAGSVIVYGVSFSVIYGIIYYIYTLFA